MKLYRNREEKMTWMVRQFEFVFKNINSILDIGCYEKYLKRYVSDRVKYVGVDVYGRPDIRLDLDKKENLPFKSLPNPLSGVCPYFLGRNYSGISEKQKSIYENL